MRAGNGMPPLGGCLRIDYIRDMTVTLRMASHHRNAAPARVLAVLSLLLP